MKKRRYKGVLVIGIVIGVICLLAAGTYFSNEKMKEATAKIEKNDSIVTETAKSKKDAKEEDAKEMTMNDTKKQEVGNTIEDTKDTIQMPSIPKKEATAVSIVVEKSKHMLYLYNDTTQIASYKVGLSKNPVGKKTKVGDKKVPEGVYYVCTRNDKSKFYLSLGLSYPNETDAKDGLALGLITTQQYESIVKANEEKKRPDWYTNLGGEIMIHGGEKGSKKDWTTGCVAVDNEVMDILWEYCSMGTQVTINP